MPITSLPTETTKQGMFRPSTLNVAARLTEHIRDTRRDHRQPRSVYASQIKNCARQLAMGLMGFQRGAVGDDNPEWAVAADLGTWLHERVESWLRSIGGLVKAEFNVRSADNTVSGRVDALLADTVTYRDIPDERPPSDDYAACIDVDGTLYVLDVKTVSDKDYRFGFNSFKVPGYVAQISIYGRLLGVSKGIILLVNRNTGAMMDAEFDIDTAYADALLRRAAEITEMAALRVLPAAEQWGNEPTGSFYCRNLCPFYRQCAQQQADGSVQRLLSDGVDPVEV